MGQLTYAQMRMQFLQGTGDSEVAKEECYLHLTEGQRQICAKADLPESMKLDESVVISANTDRTLMANVDFDVFAIQSVSNSTDGVPMYPEPNGADGRRRYLVVNGLPPAGNITHWARDGRYLFVRNMPSVDTTLRLHGHSQPGAVTIGNLNEQSPLPAQYDYPIVWASIINFCTLHTQAPEGIDQATWSAKIPTLQQAIQNGMQTVQPRAEEDRTISRTSRLAGYRTTPRSLRRG